MSRVGRRFLAHPFTLLCMGLVAWLGALPSATAAVPGRQGLEIEGARDRRGFFAGAGLGFGGVFYSAKDFLPALRADVVLGGGVTKRFTLGVDLHVTPYLVRRVGAAFGGDIEATGYVFRGLYLGAALGLAGVPRRDPNDRDARDNDGVAFGLGGAARVGYEFFLNASAAMAAGLSYDVRYLPGTRFPRQTLLVAARFSFY